MSVQNRRSTTLVRGLVLIAAAATVAACSSSGSATTAAGASADGGATTSNSATSSSAATAGASGTASSATPSAGASTSSSMTAGGSADAAAALRKAYAGVVGTPPAASVHAPGTGTAWVVSCGEQVPTCAEPAEAAAGAAKAAGWKATVCDGKLNPQGWAACIRQGVSAKATGIIVIGQDCTSFQAALQEAKAAAIPTIAAGGNDCDITGGHKLFAGVVQSLPKLTAQQWWEGMGALQADWVIGKTEGKAKVLSLQFTDAIWGPWIQQGFTTELSTCSGCAVLDTLKVGNADVAGGKLPQMFSTALLKATAANAVNVPLDGWFFAGLSQAVQSSGRASKLAVIGAFGEPGNVDLIRKGTGEDASVGFSAAWVGWAGMDALLRLLAKQPVQPAGAGLQVIDATTNLPAAGQPFSYHPTIDYASAYKKAWGVG